MFNSTFLLHMGTLQELPNTLSQACSQHRGLHCNNACSMQHSRLLSGQCSRLLQPQLHEIVGVLSSVLTGERSCAHSTQAKDTVQLTANNAHSVKHNAPLSTMVRNLTISSHRRTLDVTVHALVHNQFSTTVTTLSKSLFTSSAMTTHHGRCMSCGQAFGQRCGTC